MKYAPLTQYLSSLSKTKASLRMKFSEIEVILGAKLPTSASTYVEWWANQSAGSQGPSWLAAGFIVENVDLRRKLVRFVRSSKSIAPIRGRLNRKGSQSVTKPKKDTVNEQVALDAGFTRIGEWVLDSEKIRLSGEIPGRAGVYAHVVDGYVFYVGVTKMGLKKRMYFYENPGKSQPTNLRINPLIRQALESGKEVWVIAASPSQAEWQGLPVDQIAGLEAGLLSTYSFPWNIK